MCLSRLNGAREASEGRPLPATPTNLREDHGKAQVRVHPHTVRTGQALRGATHSTARTPALEGGGDERGSG